MIRLYYNTIIIYDIRHVNYLCFSMCLADGTHREHIQLVKVDAPDIAHVDGTLSMLNMSGYTIRSPFVAGGCFWRTVFLRTSLLWRVERPRSVNYLNQVVCPLNRCIWYAPCRMLLRNFPRGHFRAGSGGTVFNSILLCVFCTLINVYR